jgi:hypothetical protein
MGLLISMQMELPMNRIKILNKTGEIPVEKSVDEIDTIDDLRVIASAGSDAVKGTNPSQWLVVFIAIMAVIIVVPILPIALAFIAGHYGNWWASNNLNERK